MTFATQTMQLNYATRTVQLKLCKANYTIQTMPIKLCNNQFKLFLQLKLITLQLNL